ncbi:MAG: hypothetical protein RLZ84_76 [Actinomycetota bacterium]
MGRQLASKSRVLALIVTATVASSLLAACGGGAATEEGAGAITDTTTDGMTTTTLPGKVWPLTGLPLDEADELTSLRPALVAKIDAHPLANPQTGLQAADIVFEENVERLTRFAAIMHSKGSDPVGPLRSGRTQDIDILGAYNKPLFAWSGGNVRVTKAVNDSDLVNVGHSASRGKGGYYREKTRKAPHNLYAKTTDLWKLAPEGSGPPQAQFVYRGTSDAMPATAAPAAGTKVSMDNMKVYWQWDPSTSSYIRFVEDLKRVSQPHMDTDGTQVSAANVVVLYVEYKRSKADRKSPEAQTIGKGLMAVHTNGVWIGGTWERKERTQPFTLKDTAGAVVRLTPGRTWVELARNYAQAIVPVGVDPKKVAWPKL